MKETDTVEEQPEETSDSRQGVQLVGEDENIHLKPLEEMIDKVITYYHPKLFTLIYVLTRHQVI